MADTSILSLFPSDELLPRVQPRIAASDRDTTEFGEVFTDVPLAPGNTAQSSPRTDVMPADLERLEQDTDMSADLLAALPDDVAQALVGLIGGRDVSAEDFVNALAQILSPGAAPAIGETSDSGSQIGFGIPTTTPWHDTSATAVPDDADISQPKNNAGPQPGVTPRPVPATLPGLASGYFEPVQPGRNPIKDFVGAGDNPHPPAAAIPHPSADPSRHALGTSLQAPFVSGAGQTPITLRSESTGLARPVVQPQPAPPFQQSPDARGVSPGETGFVLGSTPAQTPIAASNLLAGRAKPAVGVSQQSALHGNERPARTVNPPALSAAPSGLSLSVHASPTPIPDPETSLSMFFAPNGTSGADRTHPMPSRGSDPGKTEQNAKTSGAGSLNETQIPPLPSRKLSQAGIAVTKAPASAGAQMALPGAEKKLDTPLPDLVGLGPVRDFQPGQSSPALSGSVHNPRSDLARHVAQQLSASAPRPGGQPVELTLNPEELGRVRLSLSHGETAISVTIQTDRGDTLDLMRRHITLLENEFREIGYDDIRFSFGATSQGGADAHSDRQQSDPAPHDHTAPASPLQTPVPTSETITSDGLDLRL